MSAQAWESRVRPGWNLMPPLGELLGTPGWVSVIWAWLLTPAHPADEATLALMKTPRCSLPDLPASASARRRRQALAPTKWNKRNLSWRWVGQRGSTSLGFPRV